MEEALVKDAEGENDECEDDFDEWLQADTAETYEEMTQHMDRQAAASFLPRACAAQDTQTKDPAEAQDRVLRQIDARTANMDGCIHAPAGHHDVEGVLQTMSVQDPANETPLEPMTAEDIECVAGRLQSVYLRAIDILEGRSAHIGHAPLGREWPYELLLMVRERGRRSAHCLCVLGIN